MRIQSLVSGVLETSILVHVWIIPEEHPGASFVKTAMFS